MYNTEGH